GRFIVASWLDLTELPQCVAVTAIGEVLSYGLDSAASPAAWPRLFRTVHHALERGGIFLFDVAGCDRAPRGIGRTFVEGEGWTVLVETDLDAEARTLVRRITSFRAAGALYRRDFEEHRLYLCDPATVAGELTNAGFSAVATRDYAGLALPEGLIAFVARRL